MVGVTWSVGDGLALLESDEGGSFEDWLAAVEGAVASLAFRPGMGVLHDMRRVTRALATSEIAGRIFHLKRHAGTIHRYASLVMNHEEVGRLAEALAAEEGVSFRIFRDRAEAEEWARAVV